MAKLTRSRQDYLKALFALEPRGDVSTSQLAAQLSVSAPSVTHMLKSLAETRLVVYSPRAGARLTPTGRRQALAIVRRHRILETFLVRVLGLDWSEVHADAEVLEHHISDRVLEAIDRLMEHPSEDPHGHPIPDAKGRMRRRELVPLAALPRGASATVCEIPDDDGRRLAHWKRFGLVPGARVRMREVRALDDVLELEIDGRRLVTGSEGVEGVLIERRREAGHGR
jgi:DtxR family Mn-dependent transcriptional regulator